MGNPSAVGEAPDDVQFQPPFVLVGHGLHLLNDRGQAVVDDPVQLAQASRPTPCANKW